MLSGIAKRTNPTFVIHLTGTGCISDEMVNKWEGEFNPKVWSDIDDIREINNRPDGTLHSVVDRQFYSANTDLIRTAFVCPPDIYGQSTGIGNRTTFMVPQFVKSLLEKKEAFFLGAGENMRAVSHIADVVDVFCILIDNALRDGGEAQWGLDVRIVYLLPYA
jgi:nucleoside-diphosphate-sugar epimerase